MKTYKNIPSYSQKVEDDIQTLQNWFQDLHELIEGCCPRSRELSIALTSLEEACMWAVKAITHNQVTTDTDKYEKFSR